MPAAEVIRLPMAAPDDLSALDRAVAAGQVDPERVVALWCKTEGNGLRNDNSRALADLTLRLWFAGRLGLSLDAMRERLFLLVSGGSEGVVSPHLVVLSAQPAGAADGAKGLVLGRAEAALVPASLGTAAHASATARLAAAAMANAGITDPADCRLLVIRAPTDPARRGHDPSVRAAAALGAGMALGEVAAEAVTDAALLARRDLYCARVFAVARHDDAPQQVLALGHAPGGNPALAMASGALADPIDSGGVARLLASLGLHAAPQLKPEDAAKVVAVIEKGDPPLSGTVRGLRHVAFLDNDVAHHRHGRAAFAGTLAAVIGHTALLVSGGAEHHGPAEGGLVAIISRRDAG